MTSIIMVRSAYSNTHNSQNDTAVTPGDTFCLDGTGGALGPLLPPIIGAHDRVFRASPRYHPKLYFMVQNMSGNIANALPALLHSFWWSRSRPS